MATAGGVTRDEIDRKTMESRLVKGLYFAGEVTDIDGDTGGYNIQWAFSSGRAAGIKLAGAI
jgi:predicted flavoprotein YhiN